jgi:hypothetical protein
MELKLKYLTRENYVCDRVEHDENLHQPLFIGVMTDYASMVEADLVFLEDVGRISDDLDQPFICAMGVPSGKLRTFQDVFVYPIIRSASEVYSLRNALLHM